MVESGTRLGWPEAPFASELAWAESALRLVRRGVALAPSRAAVPARLASPERLAPGRRVAGLVQMEWELESFEEVLVLAGSGRQWPVR